MKALSALLCFFTALSTQAFVLKTDGTTSYVRWDLFSPTADVSTNVINLNTHAVRYFLASDAYSPTNTAAELNAVRACFAQWMAVSNSNIKFEEGGLIAPPVDVNSEDDTNIVYWTKGTTLVNGGLFDIGGSLGVTFTTWDAPSLRLIHADMVFNGVNHTWFTDINDTNTTKQLVDGVALHEIGHMIGINHSPLGGATMFWRGASGVNPQTGLHADDFAAVRFLYPTNSNYYGALKGTVLKDGFPVLGAVVTAYDAATNALAGTLTHADGSYELNKLLPGSYWLRVTPLDTNGATLRLCAGNDVDADEYGNADVVFLPSAVTSATVALNTTNTVNFTVVNGAPSWRLTRFVRPTATPFSGFSTFASPTQVRAGESNLYVGVGWPQSIPTNGTRLIIPGNGVTIGQTVYGTGTASGISHYYMLSQLLVASNATPGSRDFIVSNATTYAYAPGYLTILPTVIDDNFDGLEDNFQRTYWAPFTTAAAAPGANPDGDAFNNLAEYIAGTVPTNAASFLKVSSVSNSASGTTVRWFGSLGKKYQVSARTNLTTSGWQNFGNVVSTTNIFDNTVPGIQRYYRVQALP